MLRHLGYKQTPNIHPLGSSRHHQQLHNLDFLKMFHPMLHLALLWLINLRHKGLHLNSMVSRTSSLLDPRVIQPTSPQPAMLHQLRLTLSQLLLCSRPLPLHLQFTQLHHLATMPHLPNNTQFTSLLATQHLLTLLPRHNMLGRLSNRLRPL